MLSNTSISILVNLGAWVSLIAVFYITFFHCTRWWCCGGGRRHDIENPSPPPPSHTSQQQRRSISHHHHRHGSNPARINPCDIPQHITIVGNKSVNDDHLGVSSREIITTTAEPHPRSCSSLQLSSLQASQQRAPPSGYRLSVTEGSSECPICWEALQHQGDVGGNDSNSSCSEPCIINKCKHMFHVSCIYRWMISGHSKQTTCPVCRVVIAFE